MLPGLTAALLGLWATTAQADGQVVALQTADTMGAWSTW